MVKHVLTCALALSSPLTLYAATLPDGCGQETVQFKVATGKSHGPVGEAPADAAQIVFVQALDGSFAGKPLTRFGVDGAWVGAAKGDSYFTVTVPAGTHKVCAARQSGASAERDNTGNAVLHAVAGKTYYYEFKVHRNEIGASSAGAAGQLLGYATPDMTVQRKDTLDTAEFRALSDRDPKRLSGMPISTGTPK